MARVKIQRLAISMRGVSAASARRAIAQLGPALRRQLGSAPIAPGDRAAIQLRAAPGSGPLADRIAGPLARALRGGGER